MSPTPVSSIPQCTTTIKPDSNGWVPPGTCGYYGKMYYPSFNVAVIFSALAGAVLLGNVLQATRFPKSGLHQLAVFASSCLFTGYLARTVGTRHQQNIYFTAFSDTMVLVTPILITVLDCMLVLKMVRFYMPDSQKGAMNFIALSGAYMVIIPLLVLAVVQIITCAMIVTGNAPHIQRLGIRIYTMTIGIQEVIVLCLLGVVLKFYSKMIATTQRLGHAWVHSQVVSFGLFTSLGVISLRIAYRMVELTQVFQANTTLAHNEVFFYSFEAAPILVAVAVWGVVNMGDFAQSTEMDDGYRELHNEPGNEETIPLAAP